MIKSIKYFEENCIKKFEKLENDFLREPTNVKLIKTGLCCSILIDVS